jgi:hypothetical protein
MPYFYIQVTLLLLMETKLSVTVHACSVSARTFVFRHGEWGTLLRRMQFVLLQFKDDNNGNNFLMPLLETF